MSKKYFITDEDGEETVIEEVDSIDEPEEEFHDEVEPLTEDEILALKRLAQVADKIIEKLGTADACKDDEFEEEEELVDEEPEEEELLDEEPEIEEVIDTDEEEEEIPAKHDSKKSFGSIKKSVKKTEDSIEKSLDVESAWSKRYGGTK